MCTYRRCEFGRLGGLPALLTNWRKRRAHGGDVVGGEAAVQLAAHVAGGGADVGAHRVAESERFFTRGAQPPVACRVGHFELEIHCVVAVSASLHVAPVGVWGNAGGVRRCEAGATWGARHCIWGAPRGASGRRDRLHTQ
jgi:hypothetical protein